MKAKLMTSLMAILIIAIVLFIDVCDVCASSSTELIDEVIAETNNPRLYDWHNEELGIEYSNFTMNEKNNFESSGYTIALRSSLSSRLFGLFGVRFVETYATPASELVALTPYQQAAQSNRREIFLQGAYPLLAGRSFTLLSPWVSDWEHVFYVKGGAHYNFLGTGYGLKSESTTALAGQRPVNYKWVGELGFRLQFSLPRSFSVFMDVDHFFPLKNSDADLKQWSLMGGGLAWSFF
jgi:hypothetical protein